MAWSTEDEIKFIDNLGHGSLGVFDRRQMLALYAVAIERREVWGRVDKARIKEHLNSRRMMS